MAILSEEQIAKIRGKYKKPKEQKIQHDQGHDIRSVYAGLGKIKQRMNEDERPTYLYFIQSETTKFIKIGFTRNLNSRMSSFQLGAAEKLYFIGTILFKNKARAQIIEELVHQKFIEYQIHGEWFLPDPSLLAFIKKHIKDDESLDLELSTKESVTSIK